MPLYFAYGSNMDAQAMASRCPGARALGPARLVGHRLALMADGYATIVRDRQANVWGLLWSLELADVRPLDAYEEVARGLYVKTIQPVIRAAGGSARALVYVGAAGPARPGPANLRAPVDYLARIREAAQALRFPPAVLREIEALAAAGPGGAGTAPALPAGPPSGPAPKVRPRFATPFDF